MEVDQSQRSAQVPGEPSARRAAWMRGAGWRCAWLAGSLAAGFAVAAPFGWRWHAAEGVAAAGLAAGSCLLGGLLAMFAGSFSRGADAALYAMLMGIIGRAGVPLAVALALLLAGRDLAHAGFSWYLVAFYLLSLTVETWMSLGLVHSQGGPAEVA